MCLRHPEALLIVCVVCDGKSVCFYVDSQVVGTINQSIALPRSYMGSSDGWIEFVEGAFADFVVYAGTLSPEQVSLLFTSAKIVPQ